MAGPGIPKMSLVAQYDDLCRSTLVLTVGSEREFKIFAENQLNSFRKWKDSESDVEKLKEKILNLETDKKRLEVQVKHIRNLCEAEFAKRKKVESEKSSMERQIALIKEVLLADGVMDNQTKEKLGFLNSTCRQSVNSPPRLETIEESVSSLMASYDLTEEDIIEGGRHSSRHHRRRSKGKRSSSESRLSPKKKKFETDDSDSNGIENVATSHKATSRSNSEPASNAPEIPAFIHRGPKSDSDQFKSNTYDERRYNNGTLPFGSPVVRHSRRHTFVQKTVIRSEKCHACGKSAKFCMNVLKCQECRIICHPECKDQCPLPCIPHVSTPTKNVVGTIADYVSSIPPMIPSLIVHCIEEIETRGLKDLGLYRISGSEREVKELKEKFLKGRNKPYLKQIDVHALCSTIKEFLRSLKEPLITRSSWQTFVDAAEIKDTALSWNAVFDNVTDLPQPNRDTLAFLILHLRKVADSPHCRMPISNLAKVFGPTIVGYSVPDPAEALMLKETISQAKVMERLLSISSETWQSLLNFEPDVFGNAVKNSGNTIKTPECLQAPQSSRLGPLTSSSQGRTLNYGRSTPTSRSSKYNKPGRMKFSSPLIK